MAKLVSRTYGDALFDLAIEENKVDALLEEAQVVQNIFLQNEDVLKVLHHPQITKEEKLTFIKTVFEHGASEEMQGFLHIIIQKDRSSDMLAIFEYFIHKVKEYKGIGSAAVTSAVELTKAQKDAIEKKLLQTTKYVAFEMNYQVDASILGGLIIRIEDRVVDSSLKSQLDDMSRQLQSIQLS